MSRKLKLIVGTVVYLLELILNLNAFFQHMSNAHGCRASIWAIFIILCCATVVVNVVAIVNRRDKISLCWYLISFLPQGCVVLRFYEEWKKLDSDIESGNKSRKLRRVRFAQALLNSAPQCILQLYIMMEMWNFPAYATASLFVSSISFVWGFNAYSPPHSSVVLFIGKLGFIISRVVLVTFNLYSFTKYFHWFLFIRMFEVLYFVCYFVFYFLCCYHCIKCFGCCGRFEGQAYFTWNHAIPMITSFFDVTTCGNSVNALAYFVECIVMFCVQMWAHPVRSHHIKTLRLLTLTVVSVGFGIGCIFCGVVYFCMKSDEEADLLCYIRPPPSPEASPTRQPATVHNNPTPSCAIATRNSQINPLPAATTAYVIRKEQVFVQGPSRGAVLQRTQVCEIKRY